MDKGNEAQHLLELMANDEPEMMTGSMPASDRVALAARLLAFEEHVTKIRQTSEVLNALRSLPQLPEQITTGLYQLAITE